MALADVDLEERVRAARSIIHADRGLSPEERGELLAAAIWPEGRQGIPMHRGLEEPASSVGPRS